MDAEPLLLTGERLDERFLYHIWDAGHLLTPLKTVSGQDLQVSYQGQFNTDRGPDFHNAIISLNGEIQQGDVEIHINGYDWIAHEHHDDPHYNKVILHVVMNAGNQIRTIKENGETVEILELKDQLSDEIRKLLKEATFTPDANPADYCDLLSAIDNDTLVSTLTAWGLRRFRNKVRRFNAALLMSGFDQVLYEGIMEALGYEKNKQNMLSLAQALPLQQIRDWQSDGLTALQLVAILTCASGLLDKCPRQLDGAVYHLIHSNYEEQIFYAQKLPIEWRLFRIRPGSHPLFRLFALAGLLHRTRHQGLLQLLLNETTFNDTDSQAAFRSFMQAFRGSPLPGAEKLPKPGRSLIATIYINIFLPISHMYYDKHADSESQKRILQYYAEFPALQENHITRYMSRYLSASHNQMVNRRSVLQQGLIELFHRYCHYHLCTECAAARV